MKQTFEIPRRNESDVPAKRITVCLPSQPLCKLQYADVPVRDGGKAVSEFA